jgi:hypothetical protein
MMVSEMIEVRVSKSRERIALIDKDANGSESSITFNYLQAQDYLNRILLEKGVFFGQISKPLTSPEIRDLGDKIARAQNRIKDYRATQAATSDTLGSASNPELKVQAPYRHQPLERLSHLGSDQFLQEVLFRILQAGVWRLYLERGEMTYRLILSQNGVTQSNLLISVKVFEGLLNQLKQLAGLPQTGLEQPRVIDLERLYQGETVLLRLRFAIGSFGEQATVQVVRGEASKFYERQTLAKLGQDTAKLVDQLQSKLSEIHSLNTMNPGRLVQSEQELSPLYQSLIDLDQNLRTIF